LQVLGTGTGTTGTATTSALADTNNYTRTKRAEWLQTVASPTNVARVNLTDIVVMDRGFKLVKLAGPATGVVGGQFLMSLSTNDGAATANPGNYTNQIGFGWDAGDTNIQLMHCGPAAPATKVDTGIPKAAADRAEMYSVELENIAGSGAVTATIIRKSTGQTFSQTISSPSPLPAAGSILNCFVTANTGGANAVIGVGFSRTDGIGGTT
jgi:hypothetical protein